MNKKTQDLRLSEFIYNYGPGSIIETTNGSRIVPDLKIGLFEQNAHFSPLKTEIYDKRMSMQELNGGRIFRLPLNETSDNKHISYHTKQFPTWKLCTNNHVDDSGKNCSILFKGYECPNCGRSDYSEPIRFITVCSKGHMDDINWHSVIHDTKSNNKEIYYRWYGGSSSLSDVRIECAKCGKCKTLKDVYSTYLSCSGRSPEKESLSNNKPVKHFCKEKAVVIQRQASSSRIPNLITFFSIPPLISELHGIIDKNESLKSFLYIFFNKRMKNLNNNMDKEYTNDDQINRILKSEIEGLLEIRVIDSREFQEITKLDLKELKDIFQQVTECNYSENDDGYLQEFHALKTGSRKGIPVNKTDIKEKSFMEINPNKLLEIKANGINFEIVPISRLRTVTVQKSFMRLPGETSEPVDIGAEYNDEKERWYPGMEHFGEGIFITTKENEVPKIKPNIKDTWEKAWSEKETYKNMLFRTKTKDELRPEFVWWHTLSHLIIRTISIYAGYSSASIRERIYIDKTNNKGKASGGIVIYTTQKGADGTLGGLLSIASSRDKLKKVIHEAFELSKSCSNDPLCREVNKEDKLYLGAACFACLMISETSCEHRNLWLDRRILWND